MYTEALKDALRDYLAILAGESKPKFKSVALEPRIEEAYRTLKSCGLCARECLVDRTAGENGYCGAGDRLSVASCFEHMGEEFFFVPSLTVFLNCCTFSCQFCQNWDIAQASVPERSVTLDEAQLAAIVDHHRSCKNVNFVGGEPTPWLPFVLKTLFHVSCDLPVVWNSNFYMSESSMRLLSGLVDVYLSDFKYGNDDCALRLSDVPDYSAVVRNNHLKAFEDAELVIRHLVLPNHFDCCTRPVLDFIAEKMGGRVVVNLMDQYRPCYRADRYADINRRITGAEFQICLEYARRRGLTVME